MANGEFIARHLRPPGSVGQLDLRDRLGTLSNGSYVAACRADWFWPGSARWGIHSLTDRYVPAGSHRSAAFMVNLSTMAGTWGDVPALHGSRTALQVAVTLIRQALTAAGVATGGCNFRGVLTRAIWGLLVRWLTCYPCKRWRPMRIPHWTCAAEVALWPSMKHGKR